MKRLVLPLPPSVNHSHKQFIRGHRMMRIPTDATKKFYNHAGWLAKKWMYETGWLTTYEKKIVLRYWIFWPDRRKRDAGNVEKVLSDSLKGILFDDDQFVLPRAMDYAVDKQAPRVEVELEILEAV